MCDPPAALGSPSNGQKVHVPDPAAARAMRWPPISVRRARAVIFLGRGLGVRCGASALRAREPSGRGRAIARARALDAVAVRAHRRAWSQPLAIAVVQAADATTAGADAGSSSAATIGVLGRHFGLARVVRCALVLLAHDRIAVAIGRRKALHAAASLAKVRAAVAGRAVGRVLRLASVAGDVAMPDSVAIRAFSTLARSELATANSTPPTIAAAPEPEITIHGPGSIDRGPESFTAAVGADGPGAPAGSARLTPVAGNRMSCNSSRTWAPASTFKRRLPLS